MKFVPFTFKKLDNSPKSFHVVIGITVSYLIDEKILKKSHCLVIVAKILLASSGEMVLSIFSTARAGFCHSLIA